MQAVPAPNGAMWWRLKRLQGGLTGRRILEIPVGMPVGMPGDMVQTVDGRFELNGKVLPRSCRTVSLPPKPAGREGAALGLPADLSPYILCVERRPDVKSEIGTMDWSVGRPDQSERQELLRSGAYDAVGDNRTTMTENYLLLSQGRADVTLAGAETVRRKISSAKSSSLHRSRSARFVPVLSVVQIKRSPIPFANCFG